MTRSFPVCCVWQCGAWHKNKNIFGDISASLSNGEPEHIPNLRCAIVLVVTHVVLEVVKQVVSKVISQSGITQS